MSLEAFYLPAVVGQRFCLFHPPDGGSVSRGAVVYVHPFAEEMNKSRRMAALQARALAVAGYAVLQIDLDGCGDSSGDFCDATWESWIDDVTLASIWLKNRNGGDFWLWGLRTGCLLACEAAARIGHPSNLLLWQPVVSGKLFLQQFLRLKIAGEMLAGDSKGMMDLLREQLALGVSVEVAGYKLSPALARGLGSAELSLSAHSNRVEWIEVSGKQNVSMSPLACSRLERWRSEGLKARGTPVCGAAFWQTAEISECPALLESSILAMTEASLP